MSEQQVLSDFVGRAAVGQSRREAIQRVLAVWRNTSEGHHMEVINELMPSDPKQIQAMMEKGPDGPIFMVNLLKFREKAEYEDGRETDLTGRQAYQLYGAAVAQLLPNFGGRIFFMSDVSHLSLGQVEELWDEIAIAAYPNRAALLKMSTSAEWQAIAVHRAAGLAGQLNIETVVPNEAKAFPWLQLLLKEFE